MCVRDVRLLRARDPREFTVTRMGAPPGRRAGAGRFQPEDIGGNGPSTPLPVPYWPLRPPACWASANTEATWPTGRSASSTVDTAEASPRSARTAATRPDAPAAAGVPATTTPLPALSRAETRAVSEASRGAGSAPGDRAGADHDGQVTGGHRRAVHAQHLQRAEAGDDLAGRRRARIAVLVAQQRVRQQRAGQHAGVVGLRQPEAGRLAAAGHVRLGVLGPARVGVVVGQLHPAGDRGAGLLQRPGHAVGGRGRGLRGRDTTTSGPAQRAGDQPRRRAARSPCRPNGSGPLGPELRLQRPVVLGQAPDLALQVVADRPDSWVAPEQTPSATASSTAASETRW